MEAFDETFATSVIYSKEENEEKKSNNYFLSIYWNSFVKKRIASDTRFYIQKLLGKYLLAMNVERSQCEANKESERK